MNGGSNINRLFNYVFCEIFYLHVTEIYVIVDIRRIQIDLLSLLGSRIGPPSRFVRLNPVLQSRLGLKSVSVVEISRTYQVLVMVVAVLVVAVLVLVLVAVLVLVVELVAVRFALTK